MEPKIPFRTFGEGEPVVLLHGYAGSVSHWDPLRPMLAKYYKVIVPNLTQLTLGRQPRTFSQQIDEIHEFLQTHVSKGPVHIVAISYGGALTWGLATKYPQSVGRIVLINPMPPDPMKQFIWSGLRNFLRLPFNKLFLSIVLRTKWGRNFLRTAAETFRNVDQAPSLEPTKLEGRKLMLIAYIIERFSWILKSEKWGEWQDSLKRWQHQTFLVYEEHDPLIRYDSYEEFAKLLKCEHPLVTQGAGHISTLNSPHMITWEVMKFLLEKQPVKKSS